MDTESLVTKKLRIGADLAPEDLKRLDRIADTAEAFAAGSDLATQGDRPEYVHFVQSGMACRYKHTNAGGRAIVALLLPGDFDDLHITIMDNMDHSIGALTDCMVSRVATEELRVLLDSHPAIHRACLWAGLVDAAVLREWLVNVGRRTSEQGLAHLLCELYTRLKSLGITTDHHFHMPLTQATIGDLLGISQVHVQRTMTGLREAGLISVQDRYIHLSNFEVLAELGDFDPSYLHLNRRVD